MYQLPELQVHAASLTSLCLHGNSLSRIEGLHQVRLLLQPLASCAGWLCKGLYVVFKCILHEMYALS